MIKLRNYELRNFKNIVNSGKVAEEDFTVLTGTNSSGKSSLIQCLLLLKDIVQGRNDYQIDFTGYYVQLGDFEDVLNISNGANTIDIKLELDFERPERANERDLELYHEIIKEINNPIYKFFLVFNDEKKYISDSENSQIKIRIEYSFGTIKLGNNQNGKGKIGLDRYYVEYEYDGITINMEMKYNNGYYYIQSNRPEMIFIDDFVKFYFEKQRKNDDYEKLASMYKESDFHVEASENLVSFDNLLFPMYVYKPVKYREKGLGSSNSINSLFNGKLKRLLEYVTDDIKYLGPLRDEPQLSYFISGLNKDDIGIKGENASKVFHTKYNQKYLFNNPPINDVLDSRKESKALFEHVNTWASYILGKDISYKAKKHSPENYSLFQCVNDKLYRMTNVGVGISQIFPMLIEGIRRENGVFLLEQPEIHLHPAAQARLADFLLSISLSKRMKVIVETHSEHIINRVVRRNVRNEYPIDNSRILFIDCDGITDVERDKFGMITNWPDGFLDTGLIENERMYMDHMTAITREEE